MLHSDDLPFDEHLTDQWSEGATTDFALWTDSASYENTEFDLALHSLPTEQELMDMEANKDTGKVDDFLIRTERRTALRH